METQTRKKGINRDLSLPRVAIETTFPVSKQHKTRA